MLRYDLRYARLVRGAPPFRGCFIPGPFCALRVLPGRCAALVRSGAARPPPWPLAAAPRLFRSASCALARSVGTRCRCLPCGAPSLCCGRPSGCPCSVRACLGAAQRLPGPPAAPAARLRGAGGSWPGGRGRPLGGLFSALAPGPLCARAAPAALALAPCAWFLPSAPPPRRPLRGLQGSARLDKRAAAPTRCAGGSPGGWPFSRPPCALSL